MSLRITVSCNGTRNLIRCRAERTVGLAHSPTLRSDDPARVSAHVESLAAAATDAGWRLGAAPHGGDLCPQPHDDDPEGIERRAAELARARATLAARQAAEGLT